MDLCNWNGQRIGSIFGVIIKKRLQNTHLRMFNNIAYLPDSLIIYIILPKSILI